MLIISFIFYFFILQVISIPLLNDQEKSDLLSSPDEDPFYQPPNGFEKEKVGTILKIREAPHPMVSFRHFPQNVKKVYQILYRTMDALNQPIVTVTTLIEPYHSDSSKLISYQLAEDRPTTLCSPSYIYLKDTKGNQNNIAWNLQYELLLIDALLQQGWWVNLPDYENSKSMFTVGKTNGYAILDSIRSVLSSSFLNQSTQIQMWGYSGGAFATAWAVQLHSIYASELNIIGTSLGGTPVNIKNTLNMIDNTPNSNYIFSSILGLSEQYEDFKTYINQHLKPEKRKELDILKQQCYTTAFDNKNINDYFDRPNIMSDPIPEHILKENSLNELKESEGASLPITIPLYIYHSQHDQISSLEDVKLLVNQWCMKKKAKIEFIIDEISEHHTLSLTGASSTISFFINQFHSPSSFLLNQQCHSFTTISSLLDPKALEIFGVQLLDAFTTLLNTPIGS